MHEVELQLRDEEKHERRRNGRTTDREGFLRKVASWWNRTAPDASSTKNTGSDDTHSATLRTLRESYEFLNAKGLSITVLDLSNNSLGGKSALRPSQRLNLDFMKDTLHTLILDSNELTHHFKLPPNCESLTSLSLNNNNIKYLSALLDMLIVSCPRLAELSLLKNPCCCNYFQGKELADEKRYRMYVIGRLGGKLRVLDGTQVTQEERNEAGKVFGNWEERLDIGVAKDRRRRSQSTEKQSESARHTNGSSDSPQHGVARQEKVRRDDDSQEQEKEDDEHWDALQDKSDAGPDEESDTNADSDVTSYDLQTEQSDVSFTQSIPEQPRSPQPTRPRAGQQEQFRMLSTSATPSTRPQQPMQRQSEVSSTAQTPESVDPQRAHPTERTKHVPSSAFQLPKVNKDIHIPQEAPPPNPQVAAFQSLIAQNLRRVKQDSDSASQGSESGDDW